MIPVLPVIIAAIFVAAPALADRAPRFNSGFEEEKPREEKKEALPPFPADTKGEEWLAFEAENIAQATPLLFLPAVHMSEDRSVRYVLNLRSRSGHDNVSAEGVRCDGGDFKAYAFGDTVNRRWIEAINPRWQSTGSSANRSDAVRYAVKRVFCQTPFPDNADEIKKRFSELY